MIKHTPRRKTHFLNLRLVVANDDNAFNAYRVQCKVVHREEDYKAKEDLYATNYMSTWSIGLGMLVVF